jgi:hypothetical protein
MPGGASRAPSNLSSLRSISFLCRKRSSAFPPAGDSDLRGHSNGNFGRSDSLFPGSRSNQKRKACRQNCSSAAKGSGCRIGAHDGQTGSEIRKETPKQTQVDFVAVADNIRAGNILQTFAVFLPKKLGTVSMLPDVPTAQEASCTTCPRSWR